MESLVVVVRGAKAHPALLPFVLIALALIVWACEHKRWILATSAGVIGAAACLFLLGFPADASGRAPTTQASLNPLDAAATGARGGASRVAKRPARDRTVLKSGRFSSTVKMHPRFPGDFPVPRTFRLESNSGGTRSGNLTVRFRFTGEAQNAVCDLRAQGRREGWSVDVLAPHRMTFRKNDRLVEAWFSYPAHSVVLDIPDLR